MNNIFKYGIFLVVMVFSFYFTDKVMVYIDNKSPIMQVIEEEKGNYYIEAVNAEIKDNTIIPGLNGRKVNEHKSLLKMEEFGAFNDLYLVYDDIKPDISLGDNKEKIIVKGNDKKRSISLVLEENEILENYLNELKIKYDFIAKLESNFELDREYLNGENEDEKFSDLNAILKKKNLNTKICLLGYVDYEECEKKKYYLVNFSLDTNMKSLDLLNKINSGDIILIRESTDLEYLKLILNEVKKLDLKIIYLSELISENI